MDTFHVVVVEEEEDVMEDSLLKVPDVVCGSCGTASFTRGVS